MSNKICNDAAYLNLLDQKNRFQLLNIPPNRYNNLANNPYEQKNPTTGEFFTKNQLDMRRKVEILKYSANQSSTQTNNFTKAQIYAQIVSGKYQQRTYPPSYIQANTENNILKPCPIGPGTPSGSCDVPGPIVYLYEDTSIPLYNFNTNIDSNYGILTQGINPYDRLWNYTELIDVILPFFDTYYSTITNIFVTSSDFPITTFYLKTPIALNISGSLQEFITSYSDPDAIRIKISNINTNIKYSFSNVALKNNPSYVYNNNAIDMSLNLTNSSSFNGSCYFGMLEINNLTLPTKKGFIYDIQVNINYSITFPSNKYNVYCNGPFLKTYLNISSSFPFNKTNCIVTGEPSIPTVFPILSITSSNY